MSGTPPAVPPLRSYTLALNSFAILVVVSRCRRCRGLKSFQIERCAASRRQGMEKRGERSRNRYICGWLPVEGESETIKQSTALIKQSYRNARRRVLCYAYRQNGVCAFAYLVGPTHPNDFIVRRSVSRGTEIKALYTEREFRIGGT